MYGGNGRGKSTIAAILRSLATGDPAPVQAFKTIAGAFDPKVVLSFENGQKAICGNGAWSWSGKRPSLVVFDAGFPAAW
ncbi:MAG: hypothetical protein ACRD1M_10360 [Terriglobales bacterium]